MKKLVIALTENFENVSVGTYAGKHEEKIIFLKEGIFEDKERKLKVITFENEEEAKKTLNEILAETYGLTLEVKTLDEKTKAGN